MQPVIEHIKDRISEGQYILLTELVEAMGDAQRVRKLNEIPTVARSNRRCALLTGKGQKIRDLRQVA